MPWKNTLKGLKEAVAQGKAEQANIVETTLQLIDRISAWLPDLMKYKREEAVTYGLVAFLLTALVSANSVIGIPIASLIGVIVWLYFRYEKREEMLQQIQMLKAWKKKFEEGKDYFLKSVLEGRA
jgi:hypothetical protein